VYDIVEDPARKKPYGVRWRVTGRTTSTWFLTRPQARQFHARITVAANDGLRFNPITLLPSDWEDTPTNQICDIAHRWVQAQFPTWAPKTRDSAIGVVCDALVALVPEKAPMPKADDLTTLRRDIKNWLAAPLPTVKRSADTCPKWLRANSVSTSALDEKYCESIHTQITTMSGHLKKPSVVQRYRSNMRAMFAWGVSAGYFETQLWPSAPKRRKSTTVTPSVRVDLLPTPQQARACIDNVVSHQPGSQGYRIILAIMLYAGLRPGEARALEIADCTLPRKGWGNAVIRRAATAGTKRSTMSGQELDVPKTGEREVPLPPVLVAIIREHIGERVEGLIAPAARGGGMISQTNLDRSWSRARTKAHWRVYDLRHTCATVLIRTGAPIAEISRRMGHSPEELFRTYAGLFSGDIGDANKRFEAAIS
jgi:integrase